MKGADSWVWFDGGIVPSEAALVSVFDRGFLYGDSIYETMRSRGRRISFLEQHLDRLAASAAGIGLDLPADRDRLTTILNQTVDASPAAREAALRLTISRGEGPLGLDFSGCVPRVVVIGHSIPPGRNPAAVDGVDVIGTTVQRNPKGALDPGIKSGNFLNNIQAYREVQAAGAYEGVMLTIAGDVAEATTSNIFWIRDGTVFTPESGGILSGVTRATVISLLEKSATPCHQGAFSWDHLKGAEEVFLTSTLRGVLPVRTLDGCPLGSHQEGSLTRTIEARFEERALISATP